MRRKLIKLWVLLPVLFMLFHWTLGSQIATRDAASSHVTAALEFEKQDNWSAAEQEYLAATQLLPDATRHASDRLHLQLGIQRARARSGKIIQALEDLKKQRDEIAVSIASPAELDEIRNEIAVTSYYAAWLLRREGASRTVWEPLAESARQDFRYLAEETPSDKSAQSQMNLERVIAFERSSDEFFRTKGLPDASMASNQNVRGDAEEVEDEQRASQSQPQSGNGQRPGDKPGNSGGTGMVMRRGS